MDQLAGYNGTVSFQFILRGQPAVPTIGSVVYTIFDNAGAPLVGYTDVAVTTTVATTQISIPLPSAILTIANGKSFETRTVLVRYTINGLSYHQKTSVRVVPILNHTVTPSMVRGYTGLNERELPDDDIDLLNAYLQAETDFTSATLGTALVSGTESQLKANRAIMLKAVLQLLPSMQQRVAQSETNGPVGFTRPKVIDFEAMGRAAVEEYRSLLNAVTGADDETIPLMVLATPTDTITGA